CTATIRFDTTWGAVWPRSCSMDAAIPCRYKPPHRAGREAWGPSGVLIMATKNGTYRPTDAEPFMGERQREYFRRKLIVWKDEILEESRSTIESLQQDTVSLPDLADRATSETDRGLELRTRDRQRKLIAKIDAALRRIEEGTYGYCEETGEPIALSRLEAR